MAQQPRKSVILTTEYGSFALHILGDPNKLLEIPTAFFEERNMLEALVRRTESEEKPTKRRHSLAADNLELRAENEQLRAELEALKNALNTQKPQQD